MIAFLSTITWQIRNTQPVTKASLSSALAETMEKLENRFANDPICLLLTALQTDGRYAASFRLEGTDANCCDGEVDIDILSHQIFARGRITGKNLTDDISLYIDTENVVFSSGNIHAGSYWGTDYDTFLSDVRELPLIGGFVEDKKLESWNAGLQMLRSVVQKDFRFLQRLEDMKKFLVVALIGTPAIQEIRNVPINGQVLNCTSFVYEFSGETVSSFLPDGVCSDSAEITATFYVHEKSLPRIQMQIKEAGISQIYDLYIGKQPGEETIRLCKMNNGMQQWNVEVTTRHAETICEQTIAYYIPDAQNSQSKEIHYRYDRATGIWDWKTSEDEVLRVYLQSGQEGITLKTHELNRLVEVMNTKAFPFAVPEECTLTIKPGTAIVKPQFRNIKEWTLEDIANLAINFGIL